MSGNQFDLDPHFVKCIGYMYASKTLRKGDPVPLQYMLEEAILQKYGITKDYTDFFQSMLPSREPEEIINSSQSVVAPFEESKGSSSDNELELDLFKEDLMCIICNGMDVGAKNRLLECSDCHSLYHQECHNPVVTSEDSFENWVCHNCKEASKKIKLSLDKKENTVTTSSSKSSSKSDNHRYSSSSSSYEKKSSSSKPTDKNKSSSSKSSSPSHSSSKTSNSSSTSSRSNLQPNINIVSADKRIQIMKKKAASKLQDKRKLPR